MIGPPKLVLSRVVSLLQTKCSLESCSSSQLIFKTLLNPWAQNLLPKYAQFTIIKAFKSTETTNKSNQNVRLSRRTFYSPEDDKLIIDQVRMNGDVRATHVKIGKMLGLKHPGREVEQRYRNHLSGQIFVKGKFSPDEDKIILEHVDQHGRDDKSVRTLAEILNRGSIYSIRRRHARLMSENEYNTSSVITAWKVEEERILIRYIFDTRLNLKGIRNHQDINLIENISEDEFSECAEVLKRSNLSCYSHWMRIIVPALKTHFLGLPLNGDWKLDMMSYIVRNKIKHEKELDVGFLLDKIAPGQTKNSLLVFEKRLRRYVVNKITKRSELPLHEVVNNKLKEQSQSNPCFNKNHKGEKRRLKRANDIIGIYLKHIERQSL